MGTSGAYGGSPRGLLPSWLNEPDGGADPPVAAPAAPGPILPAATPANPAVQPAPGTQVLPPPLTAPALAPMPPYTGSFSSARAALTRFAKTRDSRALGAAASRYVNQGAGGARRAASAMGASRGVANRLVGIARDAQTIGPEQAVQRYNLGNVAGVPAADVFLSLMEVMCPPGGSISEAISRAAMLSAIEHLADAGATDFDALSPQQWEAFVLDFVACSIEEKVINELGSHLVDAPSSISDLEATEAQLHDFIGGSVRDALGDSLKNIAALTDAQVAATVETVYTAAFDFLSLLGDDA
jgi:hypothetical protein